jgi:hypothetical protein
MKEALVAIPVMIGIFLIAFKQIKGDWPWNVWGN